MKKNIDQQKLIIQQKLLDNQNMQEKITEKNKENDGLRETIKTQDTDIKNSPQYLQLINKMQKLHDQIWNRSTSSPRQRAARKCPSS